MEENNQKTISKPIKFDGIGLHSGVKSTIRVLPSPKNSGISFKRIDLKENNFVEANIKNVSSAKLCTTIKNKHGVSVSTIEHLLGAFYMTGLDNALVEISNIEVPIMDGSSKDFVEEIEKVGLVKTKENRSFDPSLFFRRLTRLFSGRGRYWIAFLRRDYSSPKF